MTGRTRSSTARTRALRAILVAVIALLGMLVSPGTASAVGEVRPTVECVVSNADGSRTAVFGYENSTGSAVTIEVGPKNKITPKVHGTPQPTTFEPGVHRGAFTVTVTGRNAPRWKVGTNSVTASASASACPSSTELPEEGNGTGPAIALAAAGLVGGVLVHRANRRARSLAAPGRDDA
ncbi:hypothetical protein SAMN06893096_1165 [Geodermatophilus pulveris]|uniref:Uncharacterized protein n=1 Tax=Geodermatophilus pulveris TaxID=1564159 RepID=A0A239JLK6_9ACTN|nr:hypothetical protein [Geodermatophilus pulveris]SNT06298.1 hypothetical protein SAMN06893096_1165 [Geodermatophilus pulveris]